MKMFKRFAAALLAGVMVLAMLTACGSNSNETESKVLNALNTACGTSYNNNADLQAKVRAVLEKVDENGYIKATDLPVGEVDGEKETGVSDVVYNKDTGDLSMVIYLVAGGVNADKTAAKLIEVNDEFMARVENVKPNSTKMDQIAEGMTVDAIGIATVNANGKTYIGYAFKVSGNVND